MPVPLRTDFDAAALRAMARTTKDGPQARRLLALAAIYDGATRTEAARIGGGPGEDIPGLGGEVQRPWARGLDQPQAARSALETHRCASRGPAGHRRARAHSGHPRRGALAVDRPHRLDLGGVPHHDLQADLEPGVAGPELSQALGPSAPSRPERGCRISL